MARAIVDVCEHIVVFLAISDAGHVSFGIFGHAVNLAIVQGCGQGSYVTLGIWKCCEEAGNPDNEFERPADGGFGFGLYENHAVAT